MIKRYVITKNSRNWKKNEKCLISQKNMIENSEILYAWYIIGFTYLQRKPNQINAS